MTRERPIAWGTILTLLAAARLASADADAELRATIERTLKERLPELAIVDIASARIPGLYEVFTGGEVAYTDRTGDHLFIGRLVDTRTRANLSAESVQARMAVELDSLPLDRAIKLVKGDGRRRLVVFADPDCPYCRRFEQALQAVNDVTVYTFLYPLEALHPEAPARARSIWCASDALRAWQDWMLEQKEPAEVTCAGDPIAELQALGRKLRIDGTPTLFLPNGRRIASALTAAQLEQAFEMSAAAPRDARTSRLSAGE